MEKLFELNRHFAFSHCVNIAQNFVSNEIVSEAERLDLLFFITCFMMCCLIHLSITLE
jgi:hypothetical protein